MREFIKNKFKYYHAV